MKFSKKSKIVPSIPEDILQKYYREISNEKIICRAPFTSMYFHPDGEVGACCLNKSSFHYGKYPKQSIKKILNSTPRKLHQKYLKNNNFLLGCKTCNDNLLNENFSGLLANGYKNQKIKPYITRIDFELSHVCNFNCIMCEQNKQSTNEIYNSSFLSEIQPNLKKIEYANFIGGEPFLINIYYDIWEYLLKNNKKCLINVQTNGSVYNAKITELLRNDKFRTVISIDSVNDETYSKIRQGGNLKEVLNNFQIFNDNMKRKSHTMQISVCPLRINRFEIPDIIEFANNNKCTIYFNQVEKPDNLSLQNIPESYLSELIQVYEKYLNTLPSNSDIEIKNKAALNGLINLIKHWHKAAITREALSVTIQKETITELLYQAITENNKSVIDEIINSIPDIIKVSHEKSAEITKLNFAKQIGLFRFCNIRL